MAAEMPAAVGEEPAAGEEPATGEKPASGRSVRPVRCMVAVGLMLSCSEALPPGESGGNVIDTGGGEIRPDAPVGVAPNDAFLLSWAAGDIGCCISLHVCPYGRQSSL